MFEKKKPCPNCQNKVSSSSNFCPFCGTQLKKKNAKDYGLLGKNDDEPMFENPVGAGIGGFGITDKLIGSLMNSIVKNFEKQMKEMDEETAKEMKQGMENAKIESIPGGMKISIGYPGQTGQKPKRQQPQPKKITKEQKNKIATFPRTKAKSDIKRLSNSIIYELSTPGVKTVDDIFVSKLEEGYEIKAIGSKKLYVNSLPINLPLKRIAIQNNKLMIEFHNQGN